MSKSILQKEWSYVVWDESADIWCCFSSFYSVQVRAEISGYPELSSSLWSFMKSCNIKNVLTLGISEFLIFTQSLRFSLMMWKKTWISNCNLQTMSLHLKLGFGHFLSGSRIKVLRIAQLLAYFFVSVFLMREILSDWVVTIMKTTKSQPKVVSFCSLVILLIIYVLSVFSDLFVQ